MIEMLYTDNYTYFKGGIMKGIGILVPLIFALTMFVSAVIKDQLYLGAWVVGVGIIISGTILWLISPKIEESEDGTIIKSSDVASFWFISLKVWSIIAFIAGVYIVIKDLVT